MMYRQPYLSLRIEHASEIAPGNRKVRSRLDRLQIASLEKQNPIYSGFIRELKGTRAAQYARPPIAAPQLLSLFHTLSLLVLLFLSLHPLVVNLKRNKNIFCHSMLLLFPFLTMSLRPIFKRWTVSMYPWSCSSIFMILCYRMIMYYVCEIVYHIFGISYWL